MVQGGHLTWGAVSVNQLDIPLPRMVPLAYSSESIRVP